MSQFLPGMLLFLVTGRCADRFDRRGILALCFALYALGAATLAIMAFTTRTSALTIYFLLAIAGAARAFAGPAEQALSAEVVPRAHFPNAVTWGSAVFNSSMIVGPALGGFLYAIADGPIAAYAAATFLYLYAFVMNARLQPSRHEQPRTQFASPLAGFHYIRKHKLILACVSLDLFAVLFGGSIALLPAFAKDILHTGQWGFGLLRSASPTGAVAMSSWLALRPLDKHPGVKMLLSVGLFGLGTIALGMSLHPVLSYLALLLIGAADIVSVIVRGTLIPLRTPPNMRGRVSAVSLVFTGASNQIGEFESGVSAQWLGVVPARVVGGIVTIAVACFYAWRFPELRRAESLTSASECRES